MQRRECLAAGVGLASTLLSAGCTGDDSNQTQEAAQTQAEETETTNHDGGEQETETDEDTPEESEPKGVTGEASLELREHELVVEEGEFSDDIYVDASVENTGEGASGAVRLTANWYDDEGRYLDEATARLHSLGEGESWDAHVRWLGTGGEDVADYELEGKYDPRFPDPYFPDGFSVEETELHLGSDEAHVLGEIVNESGEEERYFGVFVKLFDEDGVVIGSATDSVRGFAHGDTWAFEAPWSPRVKSLDRVDDYSVLTHTGNILKLHPDGEF